MAKFTVPKTKDSLISTITESLACPLHSATLIVFCKELEKAKSDEELDTFCNNLCEYHSKWHGHLICLALPSKQILSEITVVNEKTHPFKERLPI